jgi:hypothetical protein
LLAVHHRILLVTIFIDVFVNKYGSSTVAEEYRFHEVFPVALVPDATPLIGRVEVEKFSSV